MFNLFNKNLFSKNLLLNQQIMSDSIEQLTDINKLLRERLIEVEAEMQSLNEQFKQLQQYHVNLCNSVNGNMVNIGNSLNDIIKGCEVLNARISVLEGDDDEFDFSRN